MYKLGSLPNFSNLFSKPDLTAEAAPEPASIVTYQQEGLAWIDVQNPDARSLEKLTKTYDLHEIHATMSLQKGHITQVNIEKEYIFTTINFPYYVAEDNRIATSQLNIFVGKNFLITLHSSKNALLRNIFENYKQQTDLKAKYAAEILYHVIEELLKDTASITQKIFQELDDTEGEVFDDRASDAYAIGQLRQKIIGLRRTLTNQSKVLEDLGSAVPAFSEGHMGRHFKTNANVSRKLWEATEEAREIIEIYKDVDFTSSTAKTNEILAILTLLFTLTIPATVLGTFYGMNVLVPGGIEAGSWTFLGDFTMFKLIAGISIVSALLMFLYFRRKKWF
jgi:magnesium transporter